jgi:hypothetical protein
MRTALFLLSAFSLSYGCASGSSAGFALGSDDAGAPPGPTVVVATDDASMTIQVPEDGGVPLGSPFLDDASSATEDASAEDDASAGPTFDAGDGGVCTKPLGPGDLIIVELMIESTEGTGDHGEWFEVRSTLGCAVDLAGLEGECASGAKVYSLQIAGDLWLPPHGSFVVADSMSAALNHDLPGVVTTWTGQPGDVLRNEGATVTLQLGSTVVDSITYPKLKLTPGVSIAFPSDCALGLRSEWSVWQSSTASWFPAFQGTPNAPNSDVECPAEDGGT